MIKEELLFEFELDLRLLVLQLFLKLQETLVDILHLLELQPV